MRRGAAAPARSLLLAAVLAAASVSGVSAQSGAPAAAQAAPLVVSGWRYEKGEADLHVFRCEQAKCGENSRVSYRLYAPGKPMTLQQFRDSQEQVVKALEQRTPGLKATILAVDGDKKGTGVPRLYKVRRLTVAPNGKSEYVVSGLMFGSRASASLISSSREEKASNDNYAEFVLAMMMLVQTPASR